MKHLTLLSWVSLACVAACGTAEPETFSVIPSPNQITVQAGSYDLKGAAFFVDAAVPEKAKNAIEEFRVQLGTVTGKQSKTVSDEASAAVKFIVDGTLADEEYTLDVTGEGVRAAASSDNGFLFAVQTIKQMLPVEVYVNAKSSKAMVLPCVSIQDKPRFKYRGLHLDPCRHFFSIEETKKILDLMAIYKLNVLHWHLTEDQGWRMEIKQYPRLTEVSAYRNGTMINKEWGSNDGIRYGGFYTQEEMKDVVAYADKLGITVIPEIDLPGHMVAALTAYPELGCTGGPYEVWTRWGVAEDVLCVGKEETFTFLENVLTEMLDIFPSEYIHIGGDECPKVRWEKCPDCQKRIKALGLRDHDGHTAEQYLQSYVTARIQKFLNDKGRKIIGWDEILEGELAEGATVMSWRGTQGGIQAASHGFDAIMTPSSEGYYFDYYQSHETDKEPLGIGGYAPIEKVYAYEPFKGIPDDATGHILGVQANVWTEYIATPEHLEYMILPRLAALSEVQWCNADNKDFTRFDAALNHSVKIYDELGYTYCKDHWGVIGLPGSEQPARTPEELEVWLAEQKD